MQKVLVAPLDWGLGHATRCIPIIRALQQRGIEVLISAGGNGAAILSENFPHIKFLDIPGYDVSYPSKGHMAFSMLLQSPKIIKRIADEHRLLETIIRSEKITHIISDNRFGLWTENARTAFITHQMRIQAPAVIKQILFNINRSYIRKYHQLWIPDTEESPRLAGELSDPSQIDIPHTFIGPLSRFNGTAASANKKYDVIFMISGPEPQRTEFETVISTQPGIPGKKILVVRGLPGKAKNLESNHSITYLNHISDNDLTTFLHPETLFVARPGYSTLMDLVTLRHEGAVFIPTPGQTEQEYLARWWKSNFAFPFLKQEHFDWKLLFGAGTGNIPPVRKSSSLDKVISAFLGSDQEAG
jgi:predicted glycosyltransferase